MRLLSGSLVGLVAGVVLAGCGAAGEASEQTPEAGADTTSEASVIATIERDDVTVKFSEVSPGMVVVSKQFAMGDAAPKVENEQDLDLDELYQAYAPDEPVPQAIYDAMEREAEAQVASAEEEVDEEQEEVPLEVSSTPADESTQKARPAVWSYSWFHSQFCSGFHSDDVTAVYCDSSFVTNESMSKKAHRSDAVVCGNQGRVDWGMWVSGKKKWSEATPYGACEIVWHHHSHNFWGTAEKATIRWTVTYEEGPAYAASFYRNSDKFIAVPPGW